MKKLNLRSGNKSVLIIPSVSITGLTALNNMTDVIPRRPTTMSFIIHEDMDPDDTENGLMKNRRTRRSATPKIMHEYFVFSLYCAI
jgi:hypothetical protein